MSKFNLYKGFEVELFTGSFNFHVVVSVDIEKKSVEVFSSSDIDMISLSQLLDEQGYTVVQSE